MQSKRIMLVFGSLLTLIQASAMENGGEPCYEEDPAIALMKKAWEQRGKITQLRRSTSDCAMHPKLEELDRKLDKAAKLISEAQYYQYLAQQLLTQGNATIATVNKEVAALETLHEEKIKKHAKEHLPKAKL